MSALFDQVRADFPRAQTAAYFDNASSHPISVHSATALHRYVDWLTHELGEPWWPQWAQPRDQVKTLFAQLVNADVNEIAFARSTLEAESNMINGMADHLAGGNVVTTDLSFNPCIYPSYEGVVCARESLSYIHRLGVDNIRAHVRSLTDRLQEELPAKGYESITPLGNESPILAFSVPDPDAIMASTRAAGVHVAMRFGNKLRISPSVYNNHADVDRLIEALP